MKAELASSKGISWVFRAHADFRIGGGGVGGSKGLHGGEGEGSIGLKKELLSGC